MNSPRGINNLKARSSSADSDAPSSSSSKLSTGTQYFIAVLTIGAAIGNIFVMKNRKNFKFKFFKDEAQKAREHQQRHQHNNSSGSSGSGGSGSGSGGSGSGSGGSGSGGSSSSSRYKRGHEQEENVCEYGYCPIPKHLVESIEVLSLSTEKLPSEKEIKDAYRKVALVHHPDMNHRLVEEKEKSRKVFEKATIAKDQLLDVLNAK